MFCTCTWRLVFVTRCAAFSTLSFRVWHVFRGRVFTGLKRRIGSKIEFKNMIKPLDIIIGEDPLMCSDRKISIKDPLLPGAHFSLVYLFLRLSRFRFVCCPETDKITVHP
uniref:Putative secreted peptide n=1 Tax=Anopheles braziliensis TaxID=58242 RepID=A0A2M3ZN53_9DIPT